MNAIHQPAFVHKLPNRQPTTEQLCDEALALLSKLRDRLVHDDADIPACRVDEAIYITRNAMRAAMGLETIDVLP